MGDSRAGDDAGSGAPGRNQAPLTLEQIVARQGAGPSGRRAARRTGEIPVPLLPGESLPSHRGPRPDVPPGKSGRNVPVGTGGRRVGPDAFRGPVPQSSQPGLPPVPGAPPAPAPAPAPIPAPSPSPAPSRPTAPPASSRPTPPPTPSRPTPPAAVPRPVPAPAPSPAPAASSGSEPRPATGRPGVQRSAPVPPLPGGGSAVRYSQPVPPLPGRGPNGGPAQSPSALPRRGAPLPPIPGLHAPGRSGATAAPRPTRRESRAARRRTRSASRRRATGAAKIVATVVVLGLAYYLGLYVYVDRGMDRVAALAADGSEIIAPQLQENAVTYLVVGTGLPGADGPAGVAALIARVSPDEQSAVMVSLPPTALVDTPACEAADGDLREPTTEAFADSLLDGGPACMVRAVQQLSGLRIDHYLGLDLNRLPDLVDALDGVAVCLPTVTDAVAAAADPLPVGTSDLDGDRAAGYLEPGDSGTDVTGTALAERAQVLLTATLREAMTWRLLGNPVRLTSFLASATDALTVDESTNLGDLRTLAGTLGDLSEGAVQRADLPVAQVGYVPVGNDQAYVLLDRAATRSLFESVIEDGRLPDAVMPDEAAGTSVAAATEVAAPEEPAAPAAEQALTVLPADAPVDVLNGTATGGLAGTVADLLRAQGFPVGAVGNEPGGVGETVVRYGPGGEEAARTVAAAVPGAVLQPSDATAGAIQLVIGPGYSTVVPVVVPPAPAPGAAAASSSAPATVAPEPATASCV